MHFVVSLLMIAAWELAPKDAPLVEVFVPPVLGPGMDVTFMRAQRVVNEIYSGIGVRVVWRALRSAAPQDCRKQPFSGKIVVTLGEDTPTLPRSEEVLAFSYPFATRGPCVTLRMDRLRPMVQRNPVRTGFLLGHVMAHEIAHVLQGIDRHSEAGVMNNRWSEDEIQSMLNHRLRFTAFDEKLILDGLAARAQR